ncbi:HNH endonuclease [Alkalihalobacterium elongatum]|uniref:HNH endonuclease n=1 Tax=Alkalihalobacterium elongatum TaxID=2675466 RepID=UPI001C1F716F|nr:HNH endonuclease signature motif containing protein [Alkalihalobacterium elongatum]
MGRATVGTCELCERESIERTVHHLTPREEGGVNQPTALLCFSCHRQIHALYSNRELAIRLNTIELLKDDDEIKKYIKYIKKQPSSKSVPVRNTRKRR